MSFAARHAQGGRGQHGCGQERRGGQGAAHLLQQQAGSGDAQIDAAMILFHQHAGPAHFGHRGPKFAREAVGIVFVAQFAECRDRRGFGQEAARAVTQHLFFVVQYKAHEF